MQKFKNLTTMEKHQKFQKCKTGLGQFAYQKQLLKTKREEALKYLIQQGYSPTERKIILSYFDKKIDKDNIIYVHTHQINFFLQQLCKGNLDMLIKNSTCKSFKTQ